MSKYVYRFDKYTLFYPFKICWHYRAALIKAHSFSRTLIVGKPCTILMLHLRLQTEYLPPY